MADRLLPIDEQDVKLCNCADCSAELLGESMLTLVERYGKRILPCRFWKHGYVYSRYRGRPVCEECSLIRDSRAVVEED